MALVMLPCDLPWWSNVQKKLVIIEETNSLDDVIEQMEKIHDLCNVSLDPDEDTVDTTTFHGLRLYVESTMTVNEQKHFLEFTIKNMSRRAQNLRLYRPSRGLNFSLQQQTDCYELDYNLIASLLANAFFSTFPKRTEKTHPTLQDFNFTNFFRGLENNNVQKAKFRSFLYYFDWLETQKESQGECIKISRKVMTGKQWLTIEDWLESGLPLCDLQIKHEGRLDKTNSDTLQTVFANTRLGGDVLGSGDSQESLQFFTFPEILAVLLYVEALEDNESLQVDNVRHMSRIIDPKMKGIFEKMDAPKKTSLCCIDAEDYKDLPSHQFEEDNVLRELNKCLLAFRQNTTCPVIEKRSEKRGKENQEQNKGRLSPIGEREREGSAPGSPTDVTTTILIRQATSNSKKSSCESNKLEKDINKRRSWLAPDQSVLSANSLVQGPLASGRRGRFIVLGSSGECLPVNRIKNSLYSSCDSSNDEFHSARDSMDEDEDEECNKRYSLELDTPERRFTFAQKLKDALQSNSIYTDSTEDSSYAVGISVTGSQTEDQDIRLKRGGSRGFMLADDSIDEDFYRIPNSEDNELLERYRNKQNGSLERKDTNESDKYSFDSELGSELEEVYEQFAKWLDDPLLGDKNRELEPRDEAVLQFANSLLKRTLSESFVGVPLTEDGLSNSDESSKQNNNHKEKLILNARSLSLELAKHKHKLAAQLISKLAQKKAYNVNLKPVATGNWGCGQSKRGDVQLKMVIQWMAASVAGLPFLMYYTSGNEKLSKLDTVCRVLLDRKWTVGELAQATLSHAGDILDNPMNYNNNENNECLFDKLIGIDNRS